MKTRNGFVSNSSSSSFVIAVKKSLNVCPHCKRGDLNIIKLIEQYRNNYDGSDDTQVEALGWERVKEYMRDHYWQYEEEGKRKPLERELEAKIGPFLNDSWDISCISISYHDEITRNLFDNNIESGNVVIIRDNN